MSTVSLLAGDTSWCDSITCDSCGAKVERVGTGVMTRVALPVSAPRRMLLGPGLEIEYEHREFKVGALKGWGHFEIRGELDFGEGDDATHRRMDLCPVCAQVHCDALLERVKDPKSNAPFGAQEERKYGTEVPRRTAEMHYSDHLLAQANGYYARGDRAFSPHARGAAVDVPREGSCVTEIGALGVCGQRTYGYAFCPRHREAL